MATTDNGDNLMTDDLQNVTAIKFLPFWSSNPDLWFRQIEAQFTLSKIKSEKTKFNYILANLPTDIITTVVDLIQSPSDTTPYSSLKNALIERLSLSEEKRLDDILSGTQMGDQRPSEFYRAMSSTVGGSQVVSNELLLKLWKRRLPQAVSVALLTSGKEEVADLLSIADKVWETLNSSTLSSSFSDSQHNTFHHTYNYTRDNNTTPRTTPRHDELLTAIQNLTVTCQTLLKSVAQQQQQQDCVTKRLESQINSLSAQFQSNTPSTTSNYCNCHQRHTSRERYRSHKVRSRSNSKSTNLNHVCWYHRNFGKNATKCDGATCSFYSVFADRTTTNNSKNP
nr:uncharacterized protein LOC111415422 [Onthophagus taurus]